MLNKEARLANNVSIHPNEVKLRLGWNQGSVEGTDVPPHQTHHSMSSWTSLSAQGHHYFPRQ